MDGFELGDPSSTEAALIQIVYHDKHYKGKHIKLIVEAEVELVTFIGTEEDPDRRKRVCADYKLLRLSALTCELNNNETWKMNPNPAITTAIENLFSKYL